MISRLLFGKSFSEHPLQEQNSPAYHMFRNVPKPNALDDVFQYYGSFFGCVSIITENINWTHSYACYFRSGLLCVKRVTSAQTLTHLTHIQDRCLTESKISLQTKNKER